MLTGLLGKRALIYLTIEQSDKNSDGWAELSYRDLAHGSCIPVTETARYVANKMTRQGVIERKYDPTSKAYSWRINPNLDKLIEGQDNL